MNVFLHHAHLVKKDNMGNRQGTLGDDVDDSTDGSFNTFVRYEAIAGAKASQGLKYGLRYKHNRRVEHNVSIPVFDGHSIGIQSKPDVSHLPKINTVSAKTAWKWWQRHVVAHEARAVEEVGKAADGDPETRAEPTTGIMIQGPTIIGEPKPWVPQQDRVGVFMSLWLEYVDRILTSISKKHEEIKAECNNIWIDDLGKCEGRPNINLNKVRQNMEYSANSTSFMEFAEVWLTLYAASNSVGPEIPLVIHSFPWETGPMYMMEQGMPLTGKGVTVERIYDMCLRAGDAGLLLLDMKYDNVVVTAVGYKKFVLRDNTKVLPVSYTHLTLPTKA